MLSPAAVMRACAFAAMTLVLCSAWYVVSHARSRELQTRYDCIIVPGGGLDASGEPLPWVAARLDAALDHEQATDFFLVLSRGTTHKPPPTRDGFPVDEAAASARYLVERGVDHSRILLESWSLDTIGNAAFARLMHADLRSWRRCLVITSSLHMPRTRAIFEWVFSLSGAGGGRQSPTALTFEAVGERGMDAEAISSRRRKEDQALQSLKATMASVRDLAELHTFIFVRHGAYSAAPTRPSDVKGALASTY